jgi:hypothetical protein
MARDAHVKHGQHQHAPRPRVFSTARCGFPSCAWREPMVLANLRDRAIVEWDELEPELAGYDRDA